jgi:hypothetical protein
LSEIVLLTVPLPQEKEKDAKPPKNWIQENQLAFLKPRLKNEVLFEENLDVGFVVSC